MSARSRLRLPPLPTILDGLVEGFAEGRAGRGLDYLLGLLAKAGFGGKLASRSASVTIKVIGSSGDTVMPKAR